MSLQESYKISRRLAGNLCASEDVCTRMRAGFALRFGLPGAICAVAFCATEVWNTKDPSVWTTEDANTVLNNSPWAKQIKLTPPMTRRQGMGRRGGGMGYPGGGGGYPGGGGGGY